MNAKLSKLLCAVAIASLLVPAPVMANSLRLRTPVGGDLVLPESGESAQPAAQADMPAQPEAPAAPAPEAPAVPAGEVPAAPAGEVPAPEAPAVPAGDAPAQPEAPVAAAVEGSAQPEAPAGADKTKKNAPEATGESIEELGEARKDLSNEQLAFPDELKDAKFLKGDWGLDRVMIDGKGNELRSNFTFDERGRGTASYLDENGIAYTAAALAFVDDGTLKIRTTPYTSGASSKSYNAEYIECSEVNGEVICKSSSGFSGWEGQHLMRNTQKDSKNEAASASRHDEASRAASLSKSSHVATDFGPELPPAVMKTLPAAKTEGGDNMLAALNGSWRYSRDLLHKEDGQNLSLEFHFDKNGKGHSVLKNEAGGEFRADAKASALANGTLLVKTGEYQNGSGQTYYPTFMECRPSASGELDCSVSNGWSRSEGGKLLSKSALEATEKENGAGELKASASKASSSEDEMADILADMADQLNAKNKRSQSSSSASMLTLSQTEDGSMAFLEGRWLCNTGLARTTDNQPVKVEFAFDKNGKGEALVRERSGKVYKGSAEATFKNGTLRINTSRYYGPTQADGTYSSSTIRCQNEGGYALCSGRNGGVSWSNARFTRIK